MSPRRERSGRLERLERGIVAAPNPDSFEAARASAFASLTPTEGRLLRSWLAAGAPGDPSEAELAALAAMERGLRARGWSLTGERAGGGAMK